MATTTFARLRRMLQAATGLGYNFTLTTIGGAAGANIVSTDVLPYDSNQLINRWILLTSGALLREKQRVSSISNDAVGTITPVRAFTAQVANGVTFEISDYDPTAYHNALEEAMRTAARYLYLELRDETLIVDNLLLNPDMETYAASAFTNWTAVGSPTMTQETTIVMHSTNAMKMVSGASLGQKYQALTVNIREVANRAIQFKSWVYATATDTSRIRLSFDGGSTFSNHAYHTGKDQWEYQELSVAIPSTATSIRCYLETVANGTGYFDLAASWIDRITRYTIPSAFYPDGPAKIQQQVSKYEPNGEYLGLGPGNSPQPGHVLRLTGEGRLTVPTTDAGTVELDENQAELVIALAASYLHRSLKVTEPGNRAFHEKAQEDWEKKVNQIIPHSFMVAMPSDRPEDRGWKTMLDSNGTLYLLLPQRRG